MAITKDALDDILKSRELWGAFDKPAIKLLTDRESSATSEHFLSPGTDSAPSLEVDKLRGERGAGREETAISGQ